MSTYPPMCAPQKEFFDAGGGPSREINAKLERGVV
nr:MAG TPA: hypothetical protein [Caudoviricetes sp.]